MEGGMPMRVEQLGWLYAGHRKKFYKNTNFLKGVEFNA
jgi:hypothetical protein